MDKNAHTAWGHVGKKAPQFLIKLCSKSHIEKEERETFSFSFIIVDWLDTKRSWYFHEMKILWAFIKSIIFSLQRNFLAFEALP